MAGCRSLFDWPLLAVSKIGLGGISHFPSCCITHSLEMPAFLTADEIALIAVMSELSSCVISPVAPSHRDCSSNMKRVNVMKSVCISSEPILRLR